MKKEKIVANQLQCMFLEGKLDGFKEEYINLITRKLRTGEITLSELLTSNSIFSENVPETYGRLFL